MKQLLDIIVRRRWLIIVPFVVVFLIPAIFNYYSLRPYESSSLVWLETDLKTTVTVGASGSQTPIQTLSDAFEQMVQSDSFVTAVVREASAAASGSVVSDGAVAYYRGNVGVVVVGPNAMRITFSGSTPEEAMAGAEAMTDVFLRLMQSQTGKSNGVLSETFAETADSYRKQVDAARRALDTFVASHPELESDDATDEVLEEHSRLSAALVLAEETQNAYNSSIASLVKQQAVSDSERAQYADRLRVVDDPDKPLSFSKKKMILADMVALLAFGLISGTAIALVQAGDRTLRQASDVEAAAGVPVLGRVSRLQTHWGSGAGRDPSHLLDRGRQHYDELVARLLLLGEAEPATIAVTSAVTGEGVHPVAASLAVALARCTAKDVVLVDANLQDPKLHELFGVPLVPGLRGAVEGRENAGWEAESARLLGVLRNSAVQTSLPNLWLVPAGEQMQDASRTTTSDGTRLALQGLRTRFGFVIVDCPPVLAAVDGALLGRWADGVVLTVRSGVTRADELARARALLDKDNLIGAIMVGE